MDQRATEYFRIFFEASHAILSTDSLKDVLKLLVKRTVRALGAKAGSLRLLDEETGRLELVASHLLSLKYRTKGPLTADRSIPEVLEGKVVVILNAAEDPRVQYPEAVRREGIHTILSVPVVARQKVIGVMRVYTGEPREFTPEEIEFVSALAEVGGLAIANARIREAQGVQLAALLAGVGVDLPPAKPGPKARFRPLAGKGAPPPRANIEYFRALHQIAREVLVSLDSRQVTSLAIDKVLEVSGVQGCSLRLVNETTRELDLVAARGLSEAFLKKGPVHADRSIQEALAGHPVLVEDVRADPRVEYPEALAREGIRSLLTVPIIARERVIGVLRLYAREPRQYREEEVAFLSAAAEIAGVAIMNARLYERTQYDLSFWRATLRYLDVDPEQSE
ncbi:MAG: hypothetical protein Kow0092_06160 [Deferrisomatales bacterium]